jgi:hypothetical protein
MPVHGSQASLLTCLMTASQIYRSQVDYINQTRHLDPHHMPTWQRVRPHRCPLHSHLHSRPSSSAPPVKPTSLSTYRLSPPSQRTSRPNRKQRSTSHTRLHVSTVRDRRTRSSKRGITPLQLRIGRTCYEGEGIREMASRRTLNGLVAGWIRTPMALVMT